MPCAGCGGDRIEDVMAELMPGAGRPARKPMNRPIRPKPVGWRSLPKPVETRLDRIIRGWLGTKYMDNQRVRGGGVDCRHLVAAILDDWSRATQPTPLPPAARDSGIHDPRRGFRTAKTIRERYPAIIVRDGSLEPGDVLVVRGELQGSALGRMGHTMVVTTHPGRAVHAVAGRDVRYVSIGHYPILRNYRATGKLQWT